MEAGETIPELLVRQVQSSVYLEDTIRRLAELGVDTVVEIGPGRTLSGFVRKTAKQIKCYPVETAEELEAAIENSDDPDTLERVAREKGYVKQGETLYIDVAG